MTLSMNKRRPVIIGPNTPNWAKETDVWVNTVDNTLYRYDGSQWDVIGSYGASVSAVGGFTQEQIEDFAAAMLNHANHTNLTASYNDSTGQISLVGASASGGGASLTQEEVQDYAAPLLNHANHVNASASYNDANNQIIITTPSVSGFLTTEAASATYVTQSYADSAYAQFEGNLTSAGANELYLSKNDAGQTYLTQSTFASSSANFATTTQLNNKLDTTTYAAASAGFTPGLVNIVPSSASAGSGTSSVSTLGMVTLSNASSVSLDGIFNSSYKNYKMLVNLSLTGGAYLTGRFRNNGVNDTTATAYYSGFLRINYFSNSTAIDGHGVDSSFLKLALGGGNGLVHATYDIFSPFDSSVNTVITGSQTSTQAWVSSIGALFAENRSLNGLWLAPSTGNMSGTISVYAYND